MAEQKSNTDIVRYVVMAVIIGMLAITLGPKLFAKMQEKRVLDNGTAASATIIDLDETGDYVNREPEILITVEVDGEGGEPFTAKITKVMSPIELKRYDVGTRVKIRYDPDNRRKAALVGLDKSKPAAKAEPAAAPE